MAAGNRHLGYKAALNDIEATSPGSKAAFYFGFLEKMADLVQPAADDAHQDRRRESCATVALGP